MYLPNCASISPPFLKYEKIGKVLVVGDFVARIETYDNVMVLDLTCDLEDCTISNYGRLLIHMLKCTNLHILNGAHAFLVMCFDWMTQTQA